jgi:hypothetical protein
MTTFYTTQAVFWSMFSLFCSMMVILMAIRSRKKKDG